MNPTLRNVLIHVKQLKDVEMEIPGLLLPLEPHQRVSVAFCLLAKRCLATLSMGLGKSAIAIALDLKLRELKQVTNTLVLCQSGQKYSWSDEFAKFSETATVVVDGHKPDRVTRWMTAACGPTVTIASYESVRADVLNRVKLPDGSNFYQPNLGLLQLLKFDMIVFDEITLFKNIGNILSQALQWLVAYTRPVFAIGLSGTPIHKNLNDLFGSCNIVLPGLLGDQDAFERHFIVRRNGKIVGHKNEHQLAEVMRPYFVYFDKDEVYKDRPKIVSKVRRVDLNHDQRIMYREVSNEAAFAEDRDQLRSQFAKLERICGSMAYFDPKNKSSAKIEDLKSLLLTELQHEKVVIFSKWHLMLDEVTRLILEPNGIPFIRFTGRERNLEERDQNRRHFNSDPACRIALVTTAAEMGYNFEAASYIIFLDHVYNPARVNQARSRIDRPLAQSANKFMCSIHYVTNDSFEEEVVKKLHYEASLAQRVLGAANKFDDLKADLIESLTTLQLRTLVVTGKLDIANDLAALGPVPASSREQPHNA